MHGRDQQFNSWNGNVLQAALNEVGVMGQASEKASSSEMDTGG